VQKMTHGRTAMRKEVKKCPEFFGVEMPVLEIKKLNQKYIKSYKKMEMDFVFNTGKETNGGRLIGEVRYKKCKGR